MELQNGAGDFPIVNQRKSSDVDSVGKSTYSDVFEPEVVSPADAPCSNEDGNSGTPEDEVVLQEELVNDDVRKSASIYFS